MRKTARILGMFLWCVCLSPISHAETDSAVPQKDPLTAAHQNLKDALLTVETDQQSAAECLNRIAGPYDTGYAPAESAYRSLNHTKAGPFGRQDSNQ